MGFSIGFYPLDGGDLTNDDRAGLTAFLHSRGLAVDPLSHGLFRVTDGEALSFDCAATDLQLDPIDQPEPLTGSLDHATLTQAECAFVFELCAAGRLMIVNLQGNPSYLGLTGIHTREMFPDPDHAIWIGSAADLASALKDGDLRFQDYRRRVLHDYPPK